MADAPPEQTGSSEDVSPRQKESSSHCRWCGQALPLLARLKGDRFCSDWHERQYRRQQAELFLERVKKYRRMGGGSRLRSESAKIIIRPSQGSRNCEPPHAVCHGVLWGAHPESWHEILTPFAPPRVSEAPRKGGSPERRLTPIAASLPRRFSAPSGTPGLAWVHGNAGSVPALPGSGLPAIHARPGLVGLASVRPRRPSRSDGKQQLLRDPFSWGLETHFPAYALPWATPAPRLVPATLARPAMASCPPSLAASPLTTAATPAARGWSGPVPWDGPCMPATAQMGLVGRPILTLFVHVIHPLLGTAHRLVPCLEPPAWHWPEASQVEASLLGRRLTVSSSITDIARDVGIPRGALRVPAPVPERNGRTASHDNEARWAVPGQAGVAQSPDQLAGYPESSSWLSIRVVPGAAAEGRACLRKTGFEESTLWAAPCRIPASAGGNADIRGEELRHEAWTLPVILFSSWPAAPVGHVMEGNRMSWETRIVAPRPVPRAGAEAPSAAPEPSSPGDLWLDTGLPQSGQAAGRPEDGTLARWWSAAGRVVLLMWPRPRTHTLAPPGKCRLPMLPVGEAAHYRWIPSEVLRPAGLVVTHQAVHALPRSAWVSCAAPGRVPGASMGVQSSWGMERSDTVGPQAVPGSASLSGLPLPHAPLMPQVPRRERGVVFARPQRLRLTSLYCRFPGEQRVPSGSGSASVDGHLPRMESNEGRPFLL